MNRWAKTDTSSHRFCRNRWREPKKAGTTARPAKPNGRSKGPVVHSGFTLLEIILAVAIAGMVMTAATALLVAAGNAWLLRDDRAFLETHASGVTQFLSSRAQHPRMRVQVDNANQETTQTRQRNGSGNGSINRDGAVSVRVSTESRTNAAATASNTANTSNDLSIEHAIRWQALPGASPADEPRLVIPLAAGHPLLVSQLPAEQSIEGFLQFEAESGLLLLWSSPLQEESPRRADELNRTLISPWVSAVEYLYLDPRNERWERTSTTPYDAQNEPIAPRFMRLIFSRDGIEAERLISLPTTIEGGIPLY